MRAVCWFSALVAMAIALIAAPTAVAAQKVTPSTAVESAKKSGKYVKFTIAVSFAVPAGDTAAADCTGKVTTSTKAGHKTVKWSGPLKAGLTGCVAHIKGKLSAAKYKKSLKFKSSFPGNANVAPFSSTKKLVLKTPPATPGGTTPGGGTTPSGPTTAPNPQAHKKGYWKTYGGTPYNNVFPFMIQDDDTIHFFDAQGGFEWDCGDPPSPAFGGTHFQDVMTVASDQVNHTYHYVGNSGDPHYYVYDVNYHLILNFTGPTTGYGHLDASGTWATESDCHLSEDFQLAWQS
jgi:hypothetical protein